MASCVQTHRTQLASGNPSGRAEWNFRCCFALELPNVYDDIKVIRFATSWQPPDGHMHSQASCGAGGWYICLLASGFSNTCVCMHALWSAGTLHALWKCLADCLQA